MPYAAVPFNICPSCGTEFGIDDLHQSFQTIRNNWIAEGMPWFDDISLPPPNWSPVTQLISGGFVGALLMPIGTATETSVANISYHQPFWTDREITQYSYSIAGG